MAPLADRWADVTRDLAARIEARKAGAAARDQAVLCDGLAADISAQLAALDSDQVADRADRDAMTTEAETRAALIEYLKREAQ